VWHRYANHPLLLLLLLLLLLHEVLAQGQQQRWGQLGQVPCCPHSCGGSLVLLWASSFRQLRQQAPTW
jgi:hypothetical protein